MGKTTKTHFLSWVLFTFIFTVFFSSSVGIINSGDTPQYFTTEALIKNHNVDMSAFKSDPHYFIWPDFIIKEGQHLSFRGYALSLLMIPIHLTAPFIEPLLGTDNFPSSIVTSRFTFELAVASLFTVFSALGLMIIWSLLVSLTKNKLISSVVILLLGFGTHTWKYSAYYARHGITVFLLGIVLYSTLKIYRGSKHWWLVLSISWSLAFGVDSIFFLSVSMIMAILFIRMIKEAPFVRKHFINICIYTLPGIFIVFIFLLLNLIWYSDFNFNQALKSTQFDLIPFEKRMQVLFSAPLLPVLSAVLFNFGKLSPESLSHFASLPKNTAIYTSVAYAQKYNFYGLFTVSPFLLLGMFFVIVHRNKEAIYLSLASLLLFVVNVIGNSKFYAFWGGNQYDIRYFYVYGLALAVPFAFVLKQFTYSKMNVRKIFSALFVVLLCMWSLFMGWLGVINMFKPALTGERRIWIEPFTFINQYRLHSAKEYLDATFLNRENALVAIWISIFLYILFYGSRLFFPYFRKQINAFLDGYQLIHERG